MSQSSQQQSPKGMDKLYRKALPIFAGRANIPTPEEEKKADLYRRAAYIFKNFGADFKRVEKLLKPEARLIAAEVFGYKKPHSILVKVFRYAPIPEEQELPEFIPSHDHMYARNLLESFKLTAVEAYGVLRPSVPRPSSPPDQPQPPAEP